MNREEFFKFVEKNIKSHLPMEYLDATITLQERTKLGLGDVHGLLIQKAEQNVAPVIYLDNQYEAYQNGTDMFDIMERLAEHVIDSQKVIETEKFEDVAAGLNEYGKIKGKLQMQACDFYENQKYLSSNAYTRQGDYAITYRITLNAEESIPVTNAMMNTWGISVEQLHMDALHVQSPGNTPVLYNIEEWMVKHILGGDKEEVTNLLILDSIPNEADPQMYILSNKNLENGAAMMAHLELLEQIGSMLGQDYYVLPSSRHELLLLPEDSGLSIEELSRTVQEINDTNVLPEDRLSDRVQYYDHHAKVLENAMVREERILQDIRERMQGGKEMEHLKPQKQAMSRKPELREFGPKL